MAYQIRDFSPIVCMDLFSIVCVDFSPIWYDRDSSSYYIYVLIFTHMVWYRLGGEAVVYPAVGGP